MKLPKINGKTPFIWMGVILCAVVCLGLMELFSYLRSSTPPEDSTLSKLQKTASAGLLLEISSAPKKEKNISLDKKKSAPKPLKKTSSKTEEEKILEELKIDNQSFCYVQAHEKVSRAWKTKKAWRKKLSPLLARATKEIYFSPLPWRDGDMYHVRPGETLYKISRKFHISPAFLQYLNPQLQPAKIKVGERIKVLRGPFQAKIHQGVFQLYLGKKWVMDLELAGPTLPPGQYTVKKSHSQGQKLALQLQTNHSLLLVLPPELSKGLKVLLGKNFHLQIQKL